MGANEIVIHTKEATVDLELSKPALLIKEKAMEWHHTERKGESQILSGFPSLGSPRLQQFTHQLQVTVREGMNFDLLVYPDYMGEKVDKEVTSPNLPLPNKDQYVQDKEEGRSSPREEGNDEVKR